MGKNAWIEHVQSVRKTPQGARLSYKDVLVFAKSSYNKLEKNIGEKILKPISGKPFTNSVSNIENKINNKVIKPISIKRVRQSYNKINNKFSKKFIKPLYSINKNKKRNKTNKKRKGRRIRN